jgi:hypothetical protein
MCKRKRNTTNRWSSDRRNVSAEEARRRGSTVDSLFFKQTTKDMAEDLHGGELPRGMTQDEVTGYIETFKKDGVVEVPIFDEDEVSELRRRFHNQLGINHGKGKPSSSSSGSCSSFSLLRLLFLFLTSRLLQIALEGDLEELNKLGNARAKSKAATLFYPKWKIDAITDLRLIAFIRLLMRATFSSGRENGILLFRSSSLVLVLLVCFFSSLFLSLSPHSLFPLSTFLPSVSSFFKTKGSNIPLVPSTM